ncbi:tyrosine-type recombinase/integrase [Actinopolymorpha alba]|uniref:tyrosine-type recombinase/integrase n=1 Tax=Actinopolymorpha alba TaxID=533267 RepID=UPI00036BC11B|nr:site-specific integrase [Actinopolymorpha alba]
MGMLKDGIMRRGRKWSYVIRVTDPETGVSKPRWVGGFDTEDAAKAARDEARVKARRGEYVDRNRLTVSEYLDAWIEAHAVEIKPKTLAGYRDNIRVYVKPRIGGMRLQAVRPATLSKLYRDLLESGGEGGRPLSQRTVDYVHAVLRKAFNDAVQVDEVLAVNPAERAKRPKKTHRDAPGTVWDASQLRLFLGVAQQHRLYAFFHLAAFTGARRGELLNLRWADVDLDSRAVTFRTSADVIDGGRVQGSPKGGRGRTVPIDAGTARVLRAHRKRQAEEQLLAGEAWAGGDFVFATGLGLPLYPDTVSQLMTKLIKAYNEPKGSETKPAVPLPRARLHDLRHLHATTFLLRGTPVHVVACR